MFEGWLQFAGEEVANTERLTAYVNAGLAPAGVAVHDCADCDSLAAGLGDDAYRSPLLDRPGWVDDSDPNSYDFAGVLPLEITGLSGSTRTAEVQDLADRGGVVRAATYPARTIGVTAMLVGRTSASVESGMTWLSTVLAGSAGCPTPGGSGGNCAGDELCVLRYCPDIDEAEDPRSWVTETAGPERYNGIDGTWQPGGIFHPYGPARVSQLTATNLVPNPRFFGNLGGAPTVAQWLPARATVAADPQVTRHPSGPPSMKLVENVVGGGVYVLTATTNGSRIPVAATPFTGMASIRSDGGSTGRRWQLIAYEYDATNTLLTPVPTGPLVACPAGVWTDLRFTFTPKPTTVSIRFGVQSADPAVTGATTWIAEPLVVQGTYTGAYFDGSTPAAGDATYSWAGTINASASQTYTYLPTGTLHPRIVGIDSYPCYSEGTIAVTLNSLAGPVRWRLELVGADDTVLVAIPTYTFSGSKTQTVPLDPAWDNWHVVVYIDNGAPVQFVSAVLTHHPVAGPEGCFDAATASFANVACVAGPTVVEQISTTCGTVLYRVEWTWVAGSPFPRGPATDLITGMDLITGKTASKAYAVVTRNPKDVSYAATVCAPKGDTYRPGLSDPCCGGAWVLPPKPPVLLDPCFDPPVNFARTELWVPPIYAPGNGWGALTLTIHNDAKSKRGLRMRIYPDPLRHGLGFLGAEDPNKQECAFCEEWWFSYVEPNAATVVDGVAERIWTRKTGYLDTDSSANVRGRNGGPFGFPSIDCNSGYLIVVDLPTTYPADCGRTIKAGDRQGGATLDVTITPLGF